MKTAMHLILISAMIITLSNSCASVSSVASKITVDSGEIPPDMKTEKFILIGILKGQRSYDKYVKKKYNEYQGEYVLATLDELNSKYPDVNAYRYYMYYDIELGGIISQGTTTYSYRYYILDRKTNVKYTRKTRSSFYALEMEAYLTAIERERIK